MAEIQTILTQVDASISEWLLQQSPVIVVMGIVIYILYKRMTKLEDEKAELAKDVIKLTISMENKLDSDREADKEIKSYLIEIRDIVKSWGGK